MSLTCSSGIRGGITYVLFETRRENNNMNHKVRNRIKFFIQKYCPSLVMRVRFYKIYKLHLSLKKPKWFSEKVMWLKLYYYPNSEIAIKSGDKYGMRSYITEQGFSDYLIPLYGVYNCVDEIDFNKFPSEFVLKKTNSAGDNLIVTNKDNLDFHKAKALMHNWMSTDIGISSGARHYSKMKSRIICEKYIEGISEEIQIFCFHGEAKSFQIGTFEFEDSLNVGAFSKKTRIVKTYLNTEEVDLKMKNLEFEDLIKVAEVVSSNVPLVRVDFFESKGSFYLVELTYTPGGGIQKGLSIEKQIQWGEWLQLPDKKRKRM